MRLYALGKNLEISGFAVNIYAHVAQSRALNKNKDVGAIPSGAKKTKRGKKECLKTRH